VFKAGNVFCQFLKLTAWYNGICFVDIFYGYTYEILRKMINRDSWGYSYLIVRGEILGFFKDELMRKHLSRMFSLIKNERKGIEDDQIPL